MTELEAMMLSIAIEAPVAALLGLTHGRGASARAVAAATLGTIMTHPIVWFGALALYGVMSYWPTLIIVETFAVIAEWPFYMIMTKFLWRRSLALSFIANAMSFAIGDLIT
jgi:hypothetical protein